MSAPVHTAGQQLPNGETVVSVDFVERDNGTTIETMVDTAGNLTRSLVPGPGTRMANHMTLLARLDAALVDNAAYLTRPSDAAENPQIEALTRQVTALIRVVREQHDTTAGT